MLCRSYRTAGLLCTLLIASACGPQARPPEGTPALSPGPRVTSPASTSPATATLGAVGYLEGLASIGPLQPVQRVGVPTPTPPPAACTARGLVVFAEQTGAEVARFAFGPDCDYRIALPAGSYRVELDRRGIDRTRDLPRTVTISAGQTTRLDVSIDTGIR